MIIISDSVKYTNRLAFPDFIKKTENILASDPDGISGKNYFFLYLDIRRFKAINDVFSYECGNALIEYTTDTLSSLALGNGYVCRMESDRFCVFSFCGKEGSAAFTEKALDAVSAYDLPTDITCIAGIYVVESADIPVLAMIDRAKLAMSEIKYDYSRRYNYYTEKLHDRMLSEHEMVSSALHAMETSQFAVYYQPQYNHSTGMLVGAEALVRWIHPEKGLISPAAFIPLFESTGYITRLDLYVFDKVCRYLRKCIDRHLTVVPVSFNITRYDIYQDNFVDELEAVRKKYDVPSSLLRVEITESSAVGNTEKVNEVIARLHEIGYKVEMDDFGSGYSSLNSLKDIDIDIIKLDMQFIQNSTGSSKGGTILTSIVRMADWLKLPVIAEGVETREQADFLVSIGCSYIQGYYYSRPVPEEDYEKMLIAGCSTDSIAPSMKILDSINTVSFWDPVSMDTLIFSNFVGGAAIFEYSEGRAEVLRVNKKFLQELGMNLAEKDLVYKDHLELVDKSDLPKYIDMINRAIETKEEQECETWYHIQSSCCGSESLCLRNTIRLIGEAKGRYLFYSMVRNITAEMRRMNAVLDSEKRFKMASEQVNIYYWEYTVATREMRPCFRCMRDLGLPAVVTDYPDTAIKMGIFPPEVADMYRDWHRQIAEGVPELEAVIPLTVGRVPFRVRYTTEFDENGRPVKAYGSAALVVE